MKTRKIQCLLFSFLLALCVSAQADPKADSKADAAKPDVPSKTEVAEKTGDDAATEGSKAPVMYTQPWVGSLVKPGAVSVQRPAWDEKPVAGGVTAAATQWVVGKATAGGASSSVKKLAGGKVPPKPVIPCAKNTKFHTAEKDGFRERANKTFGLVNCYLDRTFFFDVSFGYFGHDDNGDPRKLPFLIIWLIIGALFFTIRMGFINFRVMKHAVKCVAGRYSKKTDTGEVSHFQALTTALSATVGLGNIAGVAIAIGIGGPGATFWMILAGFLGMTSKFMEATAAQMYRKIRPDGHVMGGAMYYLTGAFKEIKLGWFGKILAILFCFFCIGACLGGGNAFQVSQSMSVVQSTIVDITPITKEQATKYSYVYGIVLALMVGVVIIGGLRRIAHTAEAIVPVMVVLYLGACFWIIGTNYDQVGSAFTTIFTKAFSLEAGIGGLIGVLIVGFQRATFSNEAGIGSAAIAHSAARTNYPVREGMVALLEPFIDTVIICTLTALVIVITQHYVGADGLPQAAKAVFDSSSGTFAKGAAVTNMAFKSQIPWFSYILTAAVFLFAFSTMISWSYYGERCWSYMFHEKSAIVFKLIFLFFIILGSIVSSSNILDFTDYLFFAMALPNLLALYLLQGKISSSLKEYLAKLKSGELDREAGRG